MRLHTCDEVTNGLSDGIAGSPLEKLLRLQIKSWVLSPPEMVFIAFEFCFQMSVCRGDTRWRRQCSKYLQLIGLTLDQTRCLEYILDHTIGIMHFLEYIFLQCNVLLLPSHGASVVIKQKSESSIHDVLWYLSASLHPSYMKQQAESMWSERFACNVSLKDPIAAALSV